MRYVPHLCKWFCSQQEAKDTHLSESRVFILRMRAIKSCVVSSAYWRSDICDAQILHDHFKEIAKETGRWVSSVVLMTAAILDIHDKAPRIMIDQYVQIVRAFSSTRVLPNQLHGSTKLLRNGSKLEMASTLANAQVLVAQKIEIICATRNDSLKSRKCSSIFRHTSKCIFWKYAWTLWQRTVGQKDFEAGLNMLQ